MKKGSRRDMDSDSEASGVFLAEEASEPAPRGGPDGDGDAIPTPMGSGRRRVSRVNPNETKADKFRRLGSKRVPRAIKAIRSVAALANRSQYEYTPEQAKRIMDVLADAVADLRRRYMGQRKEEETFVL